MKKVIVFIWLAMYLTFLGLANYFNAPKPCLWISCFGMSISFLLGGLYTNTLISEGE